MYDFKTLIKLPLLKNSSNTKNDMNIEEYLIEFVYDLEENNRRNIHSEAQMAPIDNDVLNFYNQVFYLSQRNHPVRKQKLSKEFVKMLDSFTYM